MEAIKTQAVVGVSTAQSEIGRDCDDSGGVLPLGDLCCWRKVWGFCLKHWSPNLLRENWAELQGG